MSNNILQSSLGGDTPLYMKYLNQSQGQNPSSAMVPFADGYPSDVFNQGLDAGQGSGFGFNTETMGNIGSGINSLGQLASLYLGAKSYKASKQQYADSKAFAETDLANQAKLTNASLESQYRQSLDHNAGNGMTVEEYMAKNGVAGSTAGG